MPNKSPKTPPHSLAQTPVGTYLAALASKEPAPGGGAVVALMGAEAAALLAMALRITGDSSEVMDLGQREALLGLLDSARERLLTLADADATAFRAVIAAYALPQNDEAARAARKATVQTAFHEAVKVPLQVMAEVDDLYRAAELVADATKPSVASDVGIGVQLLDAALKASRYNIWINLKYIHDKDLTAGIEASVDGHFEGKKAQRQKLQKQIKKLLR